MVRKKPIKPGRGEGMKLEVKERCDGGRGAGRGRGRSLKTQRKTDEGRV